MTDTFVSLQVIQAGEEHIPAIRDIAHRTWPATFGTILSPEQIAYMLDMMYSATALQEQMQRLSHVFLLLLRAGTPIGYSSYELNAGGTAVTKIHKIYILPEAQGLGGGRILLDAIRDRAIQHGQQALALNVNLYNRAIQFYTHYGFAESGREDIDIGNGYFMNDLVMTLRLR